MANESNPIATKVGGTPFYATGSTTGTATDATGVLVATIPRGTTFVGTLQVSIFAGTTAPTGTPSVTVSVEGGGTGIPADESDVFYERIPLTANFIDYRVIDIIVAARQADAELRLEKVGVLGTSPEIVAIVQGVLN